MTSTRGNWVRSLPLGIAVAGVLAAAAPAVWGQGFGPDPYRPFNSQFDPYAYPVGPATPDGGMSAMGTRAGMRGANQFQNYLNELQGADRAGVERYGIGVPYYRSAVDPSYGHGNRDYLPNRKANRTFEESLQLVNEKYLAYFEERDPRKRAKLLREYYATQARSARLTAPRRDTPASTLESADRLIARRRPTTAGAERSATPRRDLGPAEDQSGSTRLRPRTGTGSGSLIPPAPTPPGGSSRSLGSPRRSPTDVLDRARGLGVTRDRPPSSLTAPLPARRATPRSTTTDQPSSE